MCMRSRWGCGCWHWLNRKRHRFWPSECKSFIWYTRTAICIHVSWNKRWLERLICFSNRVGPDAWCPDFIHPFCKKSRVFLQPPSPIARNVGGRIAPQSGSPIKLVPLYAQDIAIIYLVQFPSLLCTAYERNIQEYSGQLAWFVVVILKFSDDKLAH